MESVLIISPQAGMGNRLRALCSALVLGEVCGRKVYHTWYDEALTSRLPRVKDMQQIGFGGLFEELVPRWTGEKVVEQCFSEWLPGTFWHRSQSSGQQRFAAGVTPVAIGEDACQIIESTVPVILLETSLVVKILSSTDWESRMTSAYQRYFSPLPLYRMQVPTVDVGISVRRGELLQYYPEARQDLLAVAAWLVPLVRDKQAILFSDDVIVRERLRTVLRLDLSLKESGLQDWERAFVEFLTLATCNEVYGTPASSFAKEAAAFGGKPYIPLREV